MFKINPCIADFKLDEKNICNLCQKKVYDLSIYSENEVIDLASNTSEGICGSAPISRMNTAYYLHPIRRFALAILVVFGGSVFTLDAKAQDTIQKIQEDVLIKNANQESKAPDIKGIVIDKNTNEPLPFVNVMVEINGKMVGATTDFDGEFNFQLTDIDTAYYRDLEVRFAYIGYVQHIVENIDITLGQIHDLGTIALEEDDALLDGFIIIGKVPIIDSDPNAHRSTNLKRKEIEKIPRSD